MGKLQSQLIAAYRIINVLTMMDIDRKEPWPDALQWLDRNGEFKPKPPTPNEQDQETPLH